MSTTKTSFEEEYERTFCSFASLHFMRDVDFLLFQSREWIADNRNSSAIFFCMRANLRAWLVVCAGVRLCCACANVSLGDSVCVCVCTRASIQQMCGKYHLKSEPAEMRELHIKPIISHWTSGTTFAVILFEPRLLFFFFFIWRCHFRRSSFSTKNWTH